MERQGKEAREFGLWGQLLDGDGKGKYWSIVVTGAIQDSR